MDRRKFIKLIGGAGVVTGVGYLGFSDFYDVIEKIIREELSYLPISEDVFSNFIEDVRKEKAFNHFGLVKELFVQAHYLAGSVGQYILPYRYKYSLHKSDIIAAFLLSTDFFYNDMDESKPLKYMRLYHPYKSACSNPFSSVYYKNV